MRLDRTTRPTAAPHRVGPAAQRIGIKELVGDTIAAKHPLTPSRGRDSAQVNEYVQRVHDWISQGQLVAAYELPWMLEADSIPVPTQHSARGTNALQPGSSPHDKSLKDNLLDAGGILDSSPITIVIDVREDRIERAFIADGNHRLSYLRMLLDEGEDVSSRVPTRVIVKIHPKH